MAPHVPLIRSHCRATVQTGRRDRQRVLCKGMSRDIFRSVIANRRWTAAMMAFIALPSPPRRRSRWLTRARRIRLARSVLVSVQQSMVLDVGGPVGTQCIGRISR